MNAPVYLVDDDEAVRSALSLLLSTVGIGVRAFAGPEDFLQALPTLDPGCLILDIRMPAISGLKLQERLTEQVVTYLEEKLKPQGVMVVIEARHLCVEMRGVKKPGCVTVTSACDCERSARSVVFRCRKPR